MVILLVRYIFTVADRGFMEGGQPLYSSTFTQYVLLLVKYNVTRAIIHVQNNCWIKLYQTPTSAFNATFAGVVYQKICTSFTEILSQH